jgi:hypothetical protein
MGLTNAERQARWRERRADELESLRTENARLRAKIQALTSDGLMTKATFNMIRKCLRPDCADPGRKKMYEDAFHEFSKIKVALIAEPTPAAPARKPKRNTAKTDKTASGGWYRPWVQTYE